jgi:hypothetical protein
LNLDETIENLRTTGKPLPIAVQDEFDNLVRDFGITGTLELIERAFVNNDISLVECHVLSHNLGHEALIYYNYDYKKALEHESHFCINGYRHGVEAQIVLDSPDYREELQKFCKVLNDKLDYANCYHGAGHVFMNSSVDLNASLEEGDRLSAPEYPDVSDWYKGVFAELTNLAGGFDGETGLHFPGEPPVKIDEHALPYCTKLQPKYQKACVYELSGLNIGVSTTPELAKERLMACLDDKYPTDLQAACIYGVAAVFAQHEVALDKKVTPMPFILDLDREIIKSYIAAVSQEIRQFILSGREFNGSEFCQSFKERDEIEFCTENMKPSQQSG